ncbi:MAG: hypothetical protein K6E38_07055 [Fretibacterium sp.]|nr:hypothetical protein [Fretibacterium sp.]
MSKNDRYVIYVWEPSSDKAGIVRCTDDDICDLRSVVLESSQEDFLQGMWGFSFGNVSHLRPSSIRPDVEELGFLSNDCEHFVIWRKAGGAESPQTTAEASDELWEDKHRAGQ